MTQMNVSTILLVGPIHTVMTVMKTIPMRGDM
ncbi:hypothetical protein E2C01_085703 [Portunus trituberculatus]|uniref:Uncharacterized protein n=1 Tax=Portunus trituberculatus TaxID=210409 RepID=A0A5B7J9L5_PORTR|nr:hypothetical protein [Portunus trituberculatus]